MITKKTSLIFLIILAMMSMSGLIATDIFLPAIPNIMNHFSLTEARAQSLISVYLIGIAVMQVVYGPISDSFGRKTVLIIGILIFCVASFAVTLFDNYHYVLLMRLIQAVGACACLTLGRAIVGDLFDKKETGKIFLVIFPFVGITPAIAPVIGGWLNIAFNWQACFYFTAAFALVLLVLIVFFLKESKPIEQRTALHYSTISSNYSNIIKTPAFWGYTASVCFAYAAYFAYIAESPFLLLKQGITTEALGYSFISLSVTYVVGNLTARYLMRKYSLDSTLMIGYTIFVTGGTLFFASLAVFPAVFIFSITAISILTFGNGFLLPLGTAGGVTAIPKLTGSSSGILGSLQLAAGAVAAQGIGVLSGHEPFKIGLIMLIVVWCGFLVQVFFYRMHKKALKKP